MEQAMDGTETNGTEATCMDQTEAINGTEDREKSMEEDDLDSNAFVDIFSGKADEENDEYCENFMSESDNWAIIFEFSRD